MTVGFEKEYMRVTVRPLTRLAGAEVKRRQGEMRGWWIRLTNTGDEAASKLWPLLGSAPRTTSRTNPSDRSIIVCFSEEVRAENAASLMKGITEQPSSANDTWGWCGGRHISGKGGKELGTSFRWSQYVRPSRDQNE